MSDTDTATPETDAAEAEETPKEPQNAPQEDADTDDGSEDWRKDFDPDKAAERIRKIQSENKNLRNRAKTAEEKAAGVDQKDQEITTLKGQLLRERVGRRLALPDELVDRLRGDDEEAILADAEKLVALLGKPASTTRKPAEQLRGGLDPEREPEEDPREVARRVRNRGF
jgi:hypothetical protein